MGMSSSLTAARISYLTPWARGLGSTDSEAFNKPRPPCGTLLLALRHVQTVGCRQFGVGRHEKRREEKRRRKEPTMNILSADCYHLCNVRQSSPPTSAPSSFTDYHGLGEEAAGRLMKGLVPVAALVCPPTYAQLIPRETFWSDEL